MADMGGSGGPGAIRTPDPQIRRLSQPIEYKEAFGKPTLKAALSDQGLSYCLQTEIGAENENPGALAGATGAGWKARHFRSAEYRKRAEAATSLCLAIAECEREDAVVIMSAALADMAIGSPLPVWINARDDARWWASYATEIELKAYAAAAFEALRPKARLAFLDHVQRRVAA